MRYEYMVRLDLGTEALNRYGAMRWELVSVVQPTFQSARTFYFKRELERPQHQ